MPPWELCSFPGVLSEPASLRCPLDDEHSVPLLTAAHQPFCEPCPGLISPILECGWQQMLSSWCLTWPCRIGLILSIRYFSSFYSHFTQPFLPGGVVKKWLHGSLAGFQWSLAPKWMLKRVHGNDVRGSASAGAWLCWSHNILQILTHVCDYSISHILFRSSSENIVVKIKFWIFMPTFVLICKD